MTISGTVITLAIISFPAMMCVVFEMYLNESDKSNGIERTPLYRGIRVAVITVLFVSLITLVAHVYQQDLLTTRVVE